MDSAVVALVPVLELLVGRRAFTANQTVAKVMVVAVVVSGPEGRCDVDQNARHATDVGRGHGRTGDGHVVEVALCSGGGVDGRAAWGCGPDVSAGGPNVRPGVLLVHATSRRKRRHGRAVVREGGHRDGRGCVGVNVGAQVARTLRTRAARVGGCEDDGNAVFVGQAVGELRDRAFGVVIAVAAPRIGDDADVVRVLPGYGVSVGPFQTLDACEN